MRELSQADREKILNRVRLILGDKKHCPFYFRNDFARVISGEEEAIYSWCATNLLMGSLLPSSLGQGTVVAPNSTVGTLDLGESPTLLLILHSTKNIIH
jgi:Golgi nucleoside diphosphatase